MRITTTVIAFSIIALTTGAQTFVTPKLGGGQVAADMVHISVFYDADMNQLQATVDDSYGTPELRALAPGYSFDPAEAYVILNGKAYNAQYGWNAGGFFTIPPGAAIWIESTDSSPGLESYEGSGRFSSYQPLFGTAASSRRWKWSGVMVHNTYAVRSPISSELFAEYHVYFGDAATGEPLPQYGDTHVRLQWTTIPLQPPLPLEFGALAETNGSPVCLHNAVNVVTNSEYIVNLATTGTAQEPLFEAQIPIISLPATPTYGGPISGHARPGSCICLQPTGLEGPAGAALRVYETPGTDPTFTLSAGETSATNVVRISGDSPQDPYGKTEGLRFVATHPGLYCLTFKAFDCSATVLHAPSPLYRVYLQAGTTVSSLVITNQTATLTFGGQRGKQFLIETSVKVGTNAGWSSVTGPLAGTNYLQRQTIPITSPSQAFFRLRIH